MEREELYKGQVLTDEEYEALSDGFARAEDTCNDVMENLREIIKGFMVKLHEKCGATSLRTFKFTVYNNDGKISALLPSLSPIRKTNEELTYELEDIKSVDTLMDIVSEIL